MCSGITKKSCRLLCVSTNPYEVIFSNLIFVIYILFLGNYECFIGFGYSLAMIRYIAWIVRARMRESAKPKMPITFSRVISAIISEVR
jgi:hypothetical protein